MSKKLKLSPWHDGSVKPVHVGVYQQVDGAYSYWNGKHWKCLSRDISEAYSFKNDGYESAWQREKWRGVLK